MHDMPKHEKRAHARVRPQKFSSAHACNEISRIAHCVAGELRSEDLLKQRPSLLWVNDQLKQQPSVFLGGHL